MEDDLEAVADADVKYIHVDFSGENWWTLQGPIPNSERKFSAVESSASYARYTGGTAVQPDNWAYVQVENIRKCAWRAGWGA